ncbi:MAG: mucoidy inhibitor MuiA family protein [Alphaproteobacteria bacterium]|nr:mucoidy inhibitor MuiA family protein [Alphaproteobacteria bacterium]
MALVTVAALPAVRAGEIAAPSSIDAVVVYPDGARVTRLIRVDLPAGDSTIRLADFPLGLDATSLRVEAEAGAKLVIGAVDARKPKAMEPVNLPEIDKRIEALKDEHSDLQDASAAAEGRRKFAERLAEFSPSATIGDKAPGRSVGDWQAAFSAVGAEIASANKAIRDAERKQRVIDRKVAALEAEREAKPPNRLEVRIEVGSSAPTSATLRVSYAIAGAHWTPLYDARLDTGGRDHKPALELVRRAEVQQATGEDWSNVAMVLSTARARGGAVAPELGSLIVRSWEPRIDASQPAPRQAAPLTRGQRMVSADLAPVPESAPAFPPHVQARYEPAEEKEAAPALGNFQTRFAIGGRVSLAANEATRNLRISAATLAPDIVVRAAPVVDATAYLEASFRVEENAPLLPGRVTAYLDGVAIGGATLGRADKDGTIRLGFGADDQVRIERVMLNRNEGSAGIILTSKVDERAFKTSVRNGHDFPVNVVIEDRLPVSEQEDVVVEMLPSTTPPTRTNVKDKRGVLEWAFEVKPAAVKEIGFAWRMHWPKEKNVYMTPG